MKWLNGRKTYIAAALLALVSLLDVFSGDMSITDFIQSGNVNTLLEAIIAAALRHGIAKAKTS